MREWGISEVCKELTTGERPTNCAERGNIGLEGGY